MSIHRDRRRFTTAFKLKIVEEVDLQNKAAELLGRTLPTADGPNGTR